MKIINLEMSGHSYRVHLFANILGLEFSITLVDVFGIGYGVPACWTKSPNTQMPLFEDGKVKFFDSNTTLNYLANKYDPEGNWRLSQNEQTNRKLHHWLLKLSDELMNSFMKARIAMAYGINLDMQSIKVESSDFLFILNQPLVSQEWLFDDKPTIADISVYSLMVLVQDSGSAFDEFPAVSSWMKRIEAINGYIPMKKSIGLLASTASVDQSKFNACKATVAAA